MIIKLIITVIVVAVILFGAVSYLPISGFLTKVGVDAPILDKGQQQEKQTEQIVGDIGFELAAQKYDAFELYANSDIIVLGDTVAEGNGVNVNTKSNVKIEGYDGKVEINGNKLTLNGTITRIILPDATFMTNNVFLTSSIESLSIEEATSKELRIGGVLGTLDVKGTKTAFTGTFVATNVKAALNLEDTLSLSGMATSIEVPEAGLRFK